MKILILLMFLNGSYAFAQDSAEQSEADTYSSSIDEFVKLCPKGFRAASHKEEAPADKKYYSAQDGMVYVSVNQMSVRMCIPKSSFKLLKHTAQKVGFDKGGVLRLTNETMYSTLEPQNFHATEGPKWVWDDNEDSATYMKLLKKLTLKSGKVVKTEIILKQGEIKKHDGTYDTEAEATKAYQDEQSEGD